MITMPVIDMAKTGQNIRNLRITKGLTIKDLQRLFRLRDATGNLQVAVREGLAVN